MKLKRALTVVLAMSTLTMPLIAANTNQAATNTPSVVQQANNKEVLIRSAQAGNANSQYQLAEIYVAEGNQKEALIWYQKAASQGHIEATKKLAIYKATGSITNTTQSNNSQVNNMQNVNGNGNIQSNNQTSVIDNVNSQLDQSTLGKLGNKVGNSKTINKNDITNKTDSNNFQMNNMQNANSSNNAQVNDQTSVIENYNTQISKPSINKPTINKPGINKSVTNTTITNNTNSTNDQINNMQNVNGDNNTQINGQTSVIENYNTQIKKPVINKPIYK